MEKWYIAAKKADFKGIGEKFGIDQVTARIIRNRDVIGDEAIREYLYGDLSALHDPLLLHGCREAVAILREKIRSGKKIRIIGDYDIDGVNATYILYTGLKRLNAEVDYEIPDRMKDGYGLNQRLIELAFEEGADTILTCDNGIAAVDQIALAKRLGMTVIVTDHHEPQYTEGDHGRIWNLPAADVLIDPRLEQCMYPFKKICGAVVAWKLITALYQAEQLPEGEWEQFLEFAAIATVGDVMDLEGENRIIVRHGLKALERTGNAGLRALINACGLGHSELMAYHIGFVIGPCINASGRLDTAKRSLRLLLSDRADEAEQIAGELKMFNDERKDLTIEGVEAAIRLIEDTALGQDRVLVIYLPECHESIAGIIAGRVRERYCKPVFILTDAAEKGMIKGSGRSIENYSMFEELQKCADLMTRFGGHPMAAGLSLEKENLEQLRRRLNDNCTLTPEDLTEKIMIDVPMPISYVTEKLVEELHLIEPFGKGNEKPLFATKNLRLLKGSLIGKNRNVLKLMVSDEQNVCMEALYYGDTEAFRNYLTDQYGSREWQKMMMGQVNSIRLSVTYYPSVNEYRDLKTLQIIIQNYC